MSEGAAEAHCNKECNGSSSSSSGHTSTKDTETQAENTDRQTLDHTETPTENTEIRLENTEILTENTETQAENTDTRTITQDTENREHTTKIYVKQDEKMGCGSWIWSYKTLAATILSLLFAILAFHPNIQRLLVRSENPGDALNYVHNFHFWSRRHLKDAQYVKLGSRSSLVAVQFYPRNTYFIIHGFLGSGLDNWIIAMKDALLKREDCNVISVTWSAGSLTAEYYTITSKVEGVGDDVGRMVKFLIDVGGLSLSQLHIIGHSLGAHVAGFTGKKLNGTLPRITGLDPAGHTYHDVAPETRLDKTDAEFVDVIHTHGCYTPYGQWSDCYGIDENIGDADFWPNGGERQPACLEDGDGAVSVKDGSSCDHGMAYVLFTESVQYKTSTTYFLARDCSKWDYYNQNLCPCSYKAQYMGYNANPSIHGTFYLNTSITAPYALLDPACSAGSYSSLQITGLIILAVILVIAFLLAIIVTSQVILGVPIVTAMGIRHIWIRSSSRTELTATTTSETYLVA